MNKKTKYVFTVMLFSWLLALLFAECKTWELKKDDNFKSPFKGYPYDNYKKHWPNHWHHPDYR